ncbi:hypothetical protein [uncultured Selenomonas sp.]|uniref:hypothetical protein n=1 Tax=uncultured Selenomonas sp. TaxID=159275 RepID=UPI0028D15790|nr:hypothetical protein [uncultured Selenomonas sp.]
MFKLGMSLVFAVIAALIVFITGLFSDARVATACLRSLAAFVCAGAFTYLVTFVLEAKGWAAFDKLPEERLRDMQAQHYDAEDIDFDAPDEPGTGSAEAFAAPMNFQPLAEDSFVHMTAPPEPVQTDETPVPA